MSGKGPIGGSHGEKGSNSWNLSSASSCLAQRWEVVFPS